MDTDFTKKTYGIKDSITKGENSLLLKNQFIVLRRHLDFIPRLEFAGQQLRRERVEQMFLDGAFEWAGAELRVVAFAGQQFLLCRRSRPA